MTSLASLPSPEERFVLGDCLNIGIDGTVYEATDTKANNMKVAIKIQKFKPENEVYLCEEYRILKNYSDHPNLPDFYGGFRKEGDDDVEIWFVMEVCLIFLT